VTPSERRTAIVELVASERFRRAWLLMDEPLESNRIPAFEGVRRMLTARGLKLVDVIDEMATIRIVAPASTARPTQADAAPPRGPARPETTRPTGPFHKAEAYARSGRDEGAGRDEFLEEAAQNLMKGSFIRTHGMRAVTGSEVPRTIIGTIEELGSRITPFGEVLSFSMRNAMCVYGPIAALDPGTIERLRSGADSGARMKVETLPRHGALQHPSATRVSVALA
jgi:hypothetical protein